MDTSVQQIDIDIMYRVSFIMCLYEYAYVYVYVYVYGEWSCVPQHEVTHQVRKHQNL